MEAMNARKEQWMLKRICLHLPAVPSELDALLLQAGDVSMRQRGRSTFEPLGNPYLDERLAGDAEARSFAVEAGDHPGGKVHVDLLHFRLANAGGREIEMRGDVLAGIKFCVELRRSDATGRLSCGLFFAHGLQLRFSWHGGPK